MPVLVHTMLDCGHSYSTTWPAHRPIEPSPGTLFWCETCQDLYPVSGNTVEETA